MAIDWVSVANVAGALANVGAVYLAWRSIRITVTEQKRLRTEEQDKAIVTQKMLWYNQVVLGDVIKQLTEFHEFADRHIREVLKERSLDNINGEQLYKVIEIEFQIIAEKLMVLRVFSEELYQTCRFLLETIWDYYTEWVQELTLDCLVDDNVVAEIQKCRIEVIGHLYDYGNKMVRGA